MESEQTATLIGRLRKDRRYTSLSDYQLLEKAHKSHSDMSSGFLLMAFIIGGCWVYAPTADIIMNVIFSLGMTISVSYGVWAFRAARRYNRACIEFKESSPSDLI